jgi:ATP-dependent RNA helicase DOB1
MSAAAADDNGGGPAAKRARLLGDDAIWRPESRHGRVNVIEANGRSCTHEVVWPARSQGAAAGGGGGGDGSTEEEQSLLPPPPRPGPPARTYPFTLDPFQQTAINCLEAGAFLRERQGSLRREDVVCEYGNSFFLSNI